MSEPITAQSEHRILFLCAAGPRRKAFRAITSAAGLRVAYQDPTGPGEWSMTYWRYDVILVDLKLHDVDCDILASLLREMENIRGQIQTPLVGIASPEDRPARVRDLTDHEAPHRVA